MSEMVVLEALTKRFGPLLAVDRVSLTVNRGEVLGFLGPNGAGKSTTMKMVAGFLAPSSGTARVAGFDVIRAPLEVKRRIGYLPEGAPTYGDMTCADFLDFIAAIRGYSGAEKRRRIAEVVEKVELEEVFRRPIETFSKGFKRRVGLAQALLHDPEVLIMDEPTDGLDPNQKHHVRGLIREMSKDKAIIISTHILEEVEVVCSRAVIIGHGKLLADGTAEDLLRRLPEHNAVVVKLPAAQAEPARAALADLPDVTRITVRNGGDVAVLTALPRDGRNAVVQVSQRLRERNIPVDEVSVERGRLDDIFRVITTGQAA